MEGIPNTKIVKVTSWLAIPADMQGEDVVGTQWAKVLHVTSEDILSPTVVTEAAHIDEPVLVEETPKKEEKPKKRSVKQRKSKTAKRTKKAMDDLKKSKRAFTKSIYGWDAKKVGKLELSILVPNWKEQNNIDWMKKQLDSGLSAASVARKMVDEGISGKNGGKWNSSSVLRVIRNDFHNTRSDDEAPRWFKKRKYSVLKK